MSHLHRELVVVRERGEELTIDELAAHVGLHPEIVERFVAFGLVEPVRAREGRAFFAVAAVTRVRVIQRMRRDIGVNLPGVGVILDLLERIEAMDEELRRLRRRLE